MNIKKYYNIIMNWVTERERRGFCPRVAGDSLAVLTNFKRQKVCLLVLLLWPDIASSPYSWLSSLREEDEARLPIQVAIRCNWSDQLSEEGISLERWPCQPFKLAQFCFHLVHRSHSETKTAGWRRFLSADIWVRVASRLFRMLVYTAVFAENRKELWH